MAQKMKGTDNYRVDDCPVLIPKENLKFFTDMQTACATNPYEKYGNSYKKKSKKKPTNESKERLYESIMNKVSKVVKEALNEEEVIVSNRTIAFVKDMIKARLVAPCLNNKEAMQSIEELVNMSEEEIKPYKNSKCFILWSEFQDWVETYRE